MWHDIEQNTDEWFALRAGKVTGSKIAKIMANYPKAFGNPAKNLAANIAVEQLTGQCIASNYSNAHMDRGHIEEPIARAHYEQEYFVKVQNGGFYDNGLTGCSPDGNVYEDGLIEIKSAIPSVHYSRIRKGGADPTYKWQRVFDLRESSRDWIDFMSYCSIFPQRTKLYNYRVHRDAIKEELQQIESRLDQFFELVDKIKKEIA